MIGAIADDFTGATDIAVAFRRAGLRTAVFFQFDDASVAPESDVLVVALKTRTIEATEAVDQSLAALTWLRARGASQIFFKYCSTFDSRPDGNIGPVVDALAEALGATHTVFAPASPHHLRTQYMGHLFVDQLLLSESPMRHHPLTPMTQSHLPTVLSQQTAHNVTLIDHRAVRIGAGRIAELLSATASPTCPYILIDAVEEDDLRAIGTACLDDVLVTGAAGLAGGLGAAHAQRLGRNRSNDHVLDHCDDDSPGVVLAGSCSARTLEQIERMKQRGHPSFRLDALDSPDSDALVRRALQWVDHQDVSAGLLIYSSLPPAQLRHVQSELGTDRAANILETAMGVIARELVDRGVRRLIVAGGETSGAVVNALEVDGGLIGPEAAPGVPWILTTGTRRISLLLKSGNFGDPELLSRTVIKEKA